MIRSILTLATLAALVPAAAAFTTPDPDEAAIRRHIEHHYFEGVRVADTALAHRAFHPVAVMYSVRDGKLAERPIPDWLSAIARGAPSPPRPDSVRRRVVTVDVTGTAAMAKLELITGDATLTDYMSLLKVDGSWVIVGKIFDRQPLASRARR